MSTDKSLFYRGAIQGLAAIEGSSEFAFVTLHAEGAPTAVYRVDAEKMTLNPAELPCGGRAILADGKTYWVAGSDRRLYRLAEKDKTPAAVGAELETAATTLALLAENRLAAAAGEQVLILDRKSGKTLQTLDLGEAAGCLAADPSGQWLVVGGGKGTVWVYTCEEKDQYVLSESDRLHEGAVTALLFEASELRFYSAGLDQKLLLTHARGKLEPEDRGRGNSHADRLTAMILAPGERFLTGGLDATVRTWPRAGAARPATLKDGVGKVVGLAIVSVHNRQQLVIACQDNTLRLFVLDAAGKFGQSTAVIRDIYAWAEREFQQGEAPPREAALRRLAELNDVPAIELLTRRIAEDDDYALRLLAAKLLAAAPHPRVPGELEKLFGHRDEAVRLAAFDGLRQRVGAGELRPADRALATGKADLGIAAVRVLEELAAKDDQALARLVKALDGKPFEVRTAALAALERVHGEDSPSADLLALESKQADIRRVALVRLLQRGLLGHSQVPSALRRACEDADPQVRHAAFLVLCCTRESLAAALRQRDPEFERQFAELEAAEQDAAEKGETKDQPAQPKKAAKAPKKKAKAAAKSVSAGELTAADFEPLLQAAASRMLDTCLRGARGLALLEDPRALGLLMQLSREQEAAARVEVCRALGALDDPRSVKRLRSLLADQAAEVRDAAFTALARIEESTPLTAAEAGLNAAHEDICRRGLEILVREVRKKAPKSPADPAWDLVRRALNGAFPKVRLEAAKATLNLGLGGEGAGALRLVLESVHEDVRRAALLEIVTQTTQPWSQELLYECLNDPAAGIRSEAFAAAAKRAKGSDLGYLEAALASRWADVRGEAVAALIKKHTQAAQTLLAKALDDDDLKVRQAALDGLVEADVAPALMAALASSHLDIRVRAATALARRGDPAALQPLLEMATAEEPQEPARRDAHLALTAAALLGLAELGDPQALGAVTNRLDHKHAPIREAAAKALVATVREASLETARAALRHEDPQVKYRAALALAYWGDASAATLVFSDAGQKVLDASERLAAALTLESVAEDQLAGFLDVNDERLRQAALALLLLLELQAHHGAPQRCLAALSSLHPRVRLAAARAVECFADRARFLEFLTQLVNDRGDQPAWSLTPEDVQTLAAIAAHGEPLLRARIAALLLLWGEPKPDAWEQAWRLHQQRFPKESEACRQQAAKQKLPALVYDEDQLRELAVGAYVGLVREQGAARGRSDAAGPLVLRVRQTALRRLAEMAGSSPALHDAVRPVLLQALGDPNQDVRMQAFEHLQALGVENHVLGAEAIATGQTDLAVRGMKLLTEGASKKDSVELLEQVMLSRTDQLALEAAQLLLERQGVVKTAEKALAASWPALPVRAVSWLAAEYDNDAKAKKLLCQALDSRFREVRLDAGIALAKKKDAKAFETLVALLNEPGWSVAHWGAATALQQLGDPRAAEALLDRVENDPKGTGNVLLLVPVAAEFRDVKIVPRLLTMLEKKDWRRPAFSAVQMVAGYDQPIEDPEEERLNRDWLKKQHPRRDDVLAQLADRCLALGDAGLLVELMPPLRWAPGKEVEPLLATLAFHSEPRVRYAALEAIAWRIRKRGTDTGPLLKALEHRDAETKFRAAEGLALAGRGDGLSILLASVELMSDIDLRRRAVHALGELADERALDLLFKLADEDAHALQEAAAEALGHLGKSDRAEEIFKILERLAKLQGGLAAHAIRGLRYFNTDAGWRLVRERLRDESFWMREAAAEALGYNDDPHTRDLLLEVLAQETEGDALRDAALQSARRLFGPDSLEPDYARLQNPMLMPVYDEQDREALDRVCRLGDPARILEILPRADAEALGPLSASLLQRDPPPVKEAEKALASQHEGTVQIAARILGSAAEKKSAKAVTAALEKWRGVWEERRERLEKISDGSGLLDFDFGFDDDSPRADATSCLTTLIWAAGRLGAAEKDLVALLAERPGDPQFRPIRLAAVAALSESSPSAAALEALATAAVGEDAEVRAVAASAVARWSPARAQELLTAAMADHVALNRLAAAAEIDLGPALRQAAGNLHYQGVALPHLIAADDVASLYAAASDKSLPETARLGAVEALARLGQEAAEERLVALGQDQENDEELRKAAWRGRRRSQRARAAAKPA